MNCDQEKPRKRLCRLCAHPRKSEIGRFMLHGSSFREFQAKFQLRDVSIYCWSRHRAHIADEVEARESTSKEAADLACTVDEAQRRRVRRRLEILAKKAEKTGKIAYAINAYAALGRSLENEKRTDEASVPEAPVFNIVFKTPEEVELERLRARDGIRELDPENALLCELEAKCLKTSELTCEENPMTAGGRRDNASG